MYGQGNYAIQNGQSTNTSAAPFQQQPPGPPPLFQRAPQVSRPPVMQWGPPSAGPQVGQPGPHTYHHAHPGVPHPYPPFAVPTSGINSSQSYSMRPPPPSQIHGSTSMLQSHQTPQQHSYWNSGMNHILPVLAPGAPRVLPPPPYSGATHQQSTGSMEVLPPPPLKAQNYGDSIPAPFIPSIHSRSQDSPVPPVVTLPPPPPAASPPGDPPLPPSSPPPSSSTANAKILSSRPAQAYSTKVRHSRWDLSIDRSSEADVVTKPVENFAAPNDVGKSEGVFKNDEGTIYSEGSPVDLTSPPPKPVDEDTEHKIVTLCQSIAKSGPEVEDVIRQKESGNPEFNFLIGGEPGSEAAVAHNYFVWMKRKFQLPCKSQEAQGNNQSSLIFPGAYSSHQHAHSVNTPPSHSPVDSDMEMEDDITQLDEDQHICSFVAEKQFKDNTVKDTLSCSGPLLPVELGRGTIESSYHAMSSSQEPFAKADIVKRDAECVMGGSVQKSSTLEIRLDHPIASATHTTLEKLHNQLTEGASPFRLIQGYVSDDSLGNDDEIRLENVSPLTVSPSNELVTIAETDTGKSPKSSARHLSVAGEDDEASSAEKYVDFIDNRDENQKFVKNITAPEGPNREYAPKDGVDNGEKFDLPRKDAKDKSPTLEVDEFGRLVRERASDSESDYSPGYKRRIGKRRRSRSRSHSPYDRRRRRSPWRRKENRGRSRSISPKRHRSRSKSPSRNKLTFGGDTSRRERGHVAQCFNFLRGKCYRGASCRYYHAEPEKSSRSGSYRSEHQHQDLPPISKDSDIHEEIETTTLKMSVHKHDEAKSREVKLHQDIPNMITKDLQESEPTFQLHGKGSQVEHSASDVIDEVQKLQGDASGGMSSSIGTMEINLSQGHVSGQMYQNADEKPKEKGDSSTVQALSALLPVQIPQFPTPKECQSNVVQAAHLSASFPPQLSSTSCAQQMTRDCNLMPQFNPAPFSFQQSPFPAASSSTWNCLPPPPPPPPRPNLSVMNESAGSAVHGQHGVPSLHFLPNRVVTRSDFTFQTSVRPYTSLLPNISQTGQCQAYVQSQPVFSRGSPTNRAPTFPGEPLPLGELPGLSSRRHPYMQQPLHGPHFPETAGVSRHLGEAGVSSSMSRYTSDIVDQNQPSCLPDFGGSSFSNHFNPYSSTFSQPLPTKFSSDPLVHGENILPENYDGASFSLSNGRPATSLGSRIPTPPESALVAQAVFPRPGSDQYDPLYDSIEPSTNSFQKSDPGQNLKPIDDSGIILRLSGSNNSLDMEENKQQKGGGTIALSDSVENDEYGETAEAEVGAVENGSASESSDAADIVTGDIEIDQVKRSGKKKKSKDSRSMKLFKSAVAGFVKELLKPSWRQGNMSKEVFKTIVKKTVDKVSGAMKSHHIPKSKPKIDHYIDSSQRKLTKLVMGYVDKYVKV